VAFHIRFQQQKFLSLHLKVSCVSEFQSVRLSFSTEADDGTLVGPY